MCDHDNREAAMTVIRRDENGKPTVWCDPCLEPLITALNDAGLATTSSCCGHEGSADRGTGTVSWVSLADGRWVVIYPDYESYLAKQDPQLLASQNPITTNEQLQELRDGTVLLQEPIDGFSDSDTHPMYWVVMRFPDGSVFIYDVQSPGTYRTMEYVGEPLTVAYEPPKPMPRTPESYRYKFEQGTLTDPYTVVATRYTDRRSDVDEEMNADGFWFPRAKITDQTTGEVICEAWARAW